MQVWHKHLDLVLEAEELDLEDLDPSIGRRGHYPGNIDPNQVPEYNSPRRPSCTLNCCFLGRNSHHLDMQVWHKHLDLVLEAEQLDLEDFDPNQVPEYNSPRRPSCPLNCCFLGRNSHHLD